MCVRQEEIVGERERERERGKKKRNPKRERDHITSLTHMYQTGNGQRDLTQNNYDCQNFRKVFSGVPVNNKHVVSGVPKISKWFTRQ